jgi:hypothetical protein
MLEFLEIVEHNELNVSQMEQRICLMGENLKMLEEMKLIRSKELM